MKENQFNDHYSVNRMISSLTEQLTANFYEWEQRGRGWQVWDMPIEIEPPFEPFYYKEKFLVNSVIDDGKKPTFLSNIANKFLNKSAHTSITPDVVTEEFTITPKPFTDSSALHDITLSISHETKITIDQISQVLLLISSTRFPLSFEIIGTADSIIIQIVCRDYDLTYVRQILISHLPQVIFEEKANSVNGITLFSEKEYTIVDFGLSEEFMRPIKLFEKYEPDPLTGIIGVLDNLRKGEMGMIQILFKGSHSPWAKSIIHSVTDYGGESFFIDAPEMVHLAQEKVKSPLFAVVIRALTSSNSSSRSWTLMKDIASALSVTKNHLSNELIPLSNDFYSDEEHLEDMFLRRTHRSGMLLNSEELMTLVHIPSPLIHTVKLKRVVRKSKVAPSITIGHAFVIGENVYNGKTIPVSISSEQRIKHTHIIGATGSGKSTLLLNMILQDMEQGNGIAVMDPHGDLIEEVLGRVPENRINDVILFDPSDSEYPVGFNMLNAHSDLEKNILESDLVATFKRYSTMWGDQMTSILANAIQVFLGIPQGGTLIDLRKFLLEEKFRNDFLTKVTDPELKYYWEKQFPLLKGNSLSSILVRLDSFLRSKIIRNIVDQKEGLDFETIMNDRKILLVKLSQGLIGEENSGLLGTLLISKFHQTAMARQAINTKDRKNFYLYIDEFQQFITPSMTAILSGARKYKLSLTLSHQEMRQLYSQNTELVHSLISNAGTRICFRLGDFDAEKLKDGFSYFSNEDLQNLAVGEAICRVEKAEQDFNLKTYPQSLIDSKVAEQTRLKVKELSRKKYGRLKISDTPIKEERVDFHGFKEKETITFTKSIVQPKSLIEFSQKSEQSTALISVEENLSQHRYLQSLFKKLAEDRGYKAVIEAPTSDKQGRVDLSLEKGEERIAIEISITTSEDHELKNIQKCIASGYSKVIMCIPDKKRLDKLNIYINQRLNVENILFFSVEGMIGFLNSESVKEIKTVKTVKGYRVKVQYVETKDKIGLLKKETLTKLIFNSLRKVKN